MESLQTQIRTQLSQNFPDNTYLKVIVVEGNCGAGVTIWICTPSFEGLSLLQQHKLMQKELSPYGEQIHKTTLKTMTPKTFQIKKNKGLIPED